MKRLLLALLVLGGSLQLKAVNIKKADEGSPFGSIDDADIQILMAFARTQGADLARNLELAYKNDDSALTRVFLFSLKFTSLDDNARTYGHIIWSSLLNMTEGRGTDWYSTLVARQPQKVRQRVRDFLHYAISHDAPAPEMDMPEADRVEWQKLFPKDYIFGAGDPIFENPANQLPNPPLGPGPSPAGQPPRDPGRKA